MKHFLSTTAIVMALSGAAFAESHAAKEAEGEMEDTSKVTATEDGSKTSDTEISTALSSEDADNKVDVQREALTRPAMQLDGYAEADMEEVQMIAADRIEGAYVYGSNDETVGEIDALLMDGDGQVIEAVINVGGFLGIGEKPVAVSFDKIQVLRSVTGEEIRLYIDSTEEKLEALEEYEAD